MIKTTKNNILLLCIIFILTGLCGCCCWKNECLTVRGGERVIYKCDNGDGITARYYSLSDGSLNFIKLILFDGKEQTLPQVISASGARYTDDRELIWWIKGDSARVEMRDSEGNWQSKYQECKVVPDKR